MSGQHRAGLRTHWQPVPGVILAVCLDITPDGLDASAALHTPGQTVAVALPTAYQLQSGVALLTINVLMNIAEKFTGKP